MGNGCSTSVRSVSEGIYHNVSTCYGSEAATNRSIQIEDELRLQKNNRMTEIKLLLLGSGEAGKSTIVKQVRFIKYLLLYLNNKLLLLVYFVIRFSYVINCDFICER